MRAYRAGVEVRLVAAGVSVVISHIQRRMGISGFARVLCGIVNREWYSSLMNGTYSIRMGNRGRLVVPSDVRMRAGLAEGTPMVLVESENGLVLLTREQLLTRVRRHLGGRDLIGDLLEQRRSDAAREDAA